MLQNLSHHPLGRQQVGPEQAPLPQCLQESFPPGPQIVGEDSVINAELESLLGALIINVVSSGGSTSPSYKKPDYSSSSISLLQLLGIMHTKPFRTDPLSLGSSPWDTLSSLRAADCPLFQDAGLQDTPG